jgi:two-component system, OmpR family, sensor kinase
MLKQTVNNLSALPWFRSLASRLVVIGLIQLGLLALVATIIFVAQGSPRPPPPFQVITPPLFARLESLASQPEALQAALEELKRKRVEVTIYDADLRLVASTAAEPLSLPPHFYRRSGGWFEAPAGPPKPRIGPPVAVKDFMLGQSVGTLVAVGLPRESFALAPLSVLAIGCAILVLGALLTAGWIVRPINQLSQLTRTISAGNLSVRSHFARRDEIGELGQGINSMLESIEQLLARERELLADVAHELKTPLARIGVAIDLANEGNAATVKASLSEIAVDAAELVSIIDDIFTATRFDRGPGEIPMVKRRQTPSALCDLAVQRMRERHSARPLIATVAEHLPLVEVDTVLFRRALDNVLDNAHKYTLDVQKPIEISVTHAQAMVWFDIKDFGIGISPGDLPHVFSPFFRGDRSRTRSTGGVGLGLTLAKRIVNAHRGTIDVTSTLGQGSTFRIAIPAVPWLGDEKA